MDEQVATRTGGCSFVAAALGNRQTAAGLYMGVGSLALARLYVGGWRRLGALGVKA